MKLPIFFVGALASLCASVSVYAQNASAPNEASSLTRGAANGLAVFSWWGAAGRTYFIQQSEDLANWTYVPVIEPGAAQAIQWGFLSNADRFFLRLRYSDQPTSDPFAADFDGDKVSNYDELLQGTDPLLAVLDVNGLPLDWEMFYNVAVGTDANSLAPRGDGLTYQQAFNQGLSPNDQSFGLNPTLSIFSGDPQTAGPGSLLPAALVVSVEDAGGNLLSNQSVTFAVVSGGGSLQASSSAPLVNSVSARTDEMGQARVYFQLPATLNQECQISAVCASGSGQSKVTFTSTSDDGTAPPTDSPFAPTNFVSLANPDMSCEMSWENHTDDQTPVEIELEQEDGSWKVVATLPPGTTSYHLPAPLQP